jgi:hypothetical protein
VESSFCGTVGTKLELFGVSCVLLYGCVCVYTCDCICTYSGTILFVGSVSSRFLATWKISLFFVRHGSVFCRLHIHVCSGSSQVISAWYEYIAKCVCVS